MMTYETSVMEAERVTVQPKKIWMTAFILCFLILLADGVDLAFLAYSSGRCFRQLESGRWCNWWINWGLGL